MDLGGKAKRFGQHRNAFGFLRLLFASLVIVSHVPEIVDGDTRRELLHRLTGATTFGNFAVDGFFVISGYLITSSFQARRSIGDYLIKRIARIYPAFIVTSLICLAVVAPLAGAGFRLFQPHTLPADLARIVFLARPNVAGAFAGQNDSGSWLALDGALWTIQYEFACYLLVIALGKAGWLDRPRLLTLLAFACFVADAAIPVPAVLGQPVFTGPARALPGLVGVFLAGAIFFTCRASIKLSPRRALVAGCLLFFSLRSQMVADAGFALFGGYLIFFVAEKGRGTILARINNQTDISYGLYLYAWPIEKLLIKYMGSGSLLRLTVLTWLLSAASGWLSWMLVERPALKFMQAMLSRRGQSGLATA